MTKLQPRKSKPGIRQVIIPLPTEAYKAIEMLCDELNCSMREFILDAITNAVDELQMVKDDVKSDSQN